MQQHTRQVAVMKKILKDVQHLCVKQRRLRKLACSCCTSQDKNARADDGTDAQRRKRPRSQSFFKTMLRIFRIRDQLINGFLGEELAGQKASFNRD